MSERGRQRQRERERESLISLLVGAGVGMQPENPTAHTHQTDAHTYLGLAGLLQGFVDYFCWEDQRRRTPSSLLHPSIYPSFTYLSVHRSISPAIHQSVHTFFYQIDRCQDVPGNLLCSMQPNSNITLLHCLYSHSFQPKRQMCVGSRFCKGQTDFSEVRLPVVRMAETQGWIPSCANRLLTQFHSSCLITGQLFNEKSVS